MRKRAIMVMGLIALVALCMPAMAELQNVKVGGSIQIRAQRLDPGFDTLGNVTHSSPIRQLREGDIQGFNEDIAGDSFVSQRTRLNVEAELTSGVKGFIEIQSFDIWGGDESDSDITDDGDSTFDNTDDRFSRDLNGWDGNDNVQLYQAYIEMKEIGDTPLTARLGRQELVYGREWLVGNNDAGVDFSGQAFDAVKFIYDADDYRVDFWWSKLHENRIFRNDTDGDTDFYGIYGTWKGFADMVIDLYWLYIRAGENGPDGGLFDDNPGDFNLADEHALRMHTVGARWAGTFFDGAFDYNIEGAAQTGDTGAKEDIKAYAANAVVGYRFDNLMWTPRVHFEYAYFTGGNADENEKDDPTEDQKDFFRLFSDIHYGAMNLGGTFDRGMANLHIFNPGFDVKPMEKMTLGFDYYWFQSVRDDINDPSTPATAFDDEGSSVLGKEQRGDDDDADVGAEIDAFCRYDYTEDLTLLAGYAHFFAHDAIENAFGGNKDDLDYFYVQAKLTF